ncbi:hypothetical protein [Streptomyces sp. NPDC056672]|uniref:hypothetical protein n=1 Tax=Streptomyces sp. NPDC056672 TaxID=3345906 RepID=UPI0036A97D47
MDHVADGGDFGHADGVAGAGCLGAGGDVLDAGIGLREVLAAADIAADRLMKAPPSIDSIAVAGGLAGVFSGFKRPVLETARAEGVDPIDLFLALGERQVVAGQEDLIGDVARQLKAATR